MKNNYEDLDKALNIESSIVEVEKSSTSIDIPIDVSSSRSDDIIKDYEYSRANLYSLIEKGQEAINGIMELASEGGGSPRAYEVAGQLIKSVGDVADKLIDLQKKVKEVEEDVSKTTNVTNNAVFIGSTSELSKLLKQGFLNNKE